MSYVEFTATIPAGTSVLRLIADIQSILTESGATFVPDEGEFYPVEVNHDGTLTFFLESAPSGVLENLACFMPDGVETDIIWS